ncbi:hypothetical protein [Pelagicoccus albus]|nr:hypothetical protein [Pelagicoccus albus]
MFKPKPDRLTSLLRRWIAYGGRISAKLRQVDPTIQIASKLAPT